MKDKYLERDGIIEKYESRNFYANFIKYSGVVGGLSFIVIGIGSEDIKLMVMEGGAGSILYLLGDRLYRINEKRKEKALKNLENKAVLSISRRI